MPKWDRDSLAGAFAENGWLVRAREISYGLQFELDEGVKVSLFTSGNTTVQGPQSDFKSTVEVFVDAGPRATGATERRVFVVYGHDTDSRNDLERFLLRVHARPIILQNLPGVGDTIIEKLESLTDADFACVLLTPDDVGAKMEPCPDLRPRARQNVVLELGMVLSRLGRNRVAILVKGEEIEKPSDIDGLIYLQYENDVGELFHQLGATLKDVGFDIDIRDVPDS